MFRGTGVRALIFFFQSWDKIQPIICIDLGKKWWRLRLWGLMRKDWSLGAFWRRISRNWAIKFDIKNTTMGEIAHYWEAVVRYRKLSSVFCDDLDGWDGDKVGGRSKREVIYVYIYLIHFTLEQKLTKHCKAIILQFKKEKREVTSEVGEKKKKRVGDPRSQVKKVEQSRGKWSIVLKTSDSLGEMETENWP